ncbi:Nucleoside diphosphate kinase, chloroplastic [Sesamum alatum]|uniref:Nucleoside diphosphate kinase n=1 Tax=Sesamum alatum TaxID=300844 RepID=A0AAE1YSZ6_9LAMI|nr:Nucleoside diphosphate kinase, chloroplastic [Sesamum alatum]
MRSQICRSARSFLSAASKHSSRSFSGGRAAAAAAAVSSRGRVSSLASFGASESGNAYRSWIYGALALPTAAIMLQDQEAHAAEMERTFIAIKPDGVQRGLISEIVSRFERKGFKLVAIKIVIPSKDFAERHYHDLKERPFFNGLCDFLSSGPVLAMVWEGEGVIKYGRKLIGATDPQKSEPGTIRGDLAVVVGRNIIHGSDGPETAKDEINLWFKPEELVNYTSNAENIFHFQMAAKPLTTEAIALTEKKMDMTLDDIIKMSKTNGAKPKNQRVSNRGQKFVNNAAQDKFSKARRFMDTRSSLRQGALARRRSNFQGNQFPLATEAARKAAVAPIRNRAFNRSKPFNVNKPRAGSSTVQKVAANGGGFTVKKQPQQANVGPKQKPQTLDSLFANMKEQRMRVLSQQNNGTRRNGGGQPRVPWARNRLRN